jgi:hypothetical protein
VTDADANALGFYFPDGQKLTVTDDRQTRKSGRLSGSEMCPLRSDTGAVRSNAACQEGQGFSVDFFSSFFMVPSDDSVTLFSFFSTVPSLLTFSLSVLEIVRSQPIINADSDRADIVAINAVLPVFIVSPFYVAVFFSSGLGQALAER